MNEDSQALARRARQKKIVTLLGAGLILAGLIVLFALPRMPVPLRILAGLTDVIAGLVLLIVARQKF